MRIRRPLIFATAIIGLALSSVALAKEDGLSIVRTFTGWRDGATFKHISEYFDGKENTGRETVLRTHPDQRTGYYFLVRVANPGAPLPVRFQLQLFEPGTAAARTVAFPANLKSGSEVFQLGLTGPAWQDAKSQPVAWQLQILADDGRVLATEKSYLWEKPADK